MTAPLCGLSAGVANVPGEPADELAPAVGWHLADNVSVPPPGSLKQRSKSTSPRHEFDELVDRFSRPEFFLGALGTFRAWIR